MRWHAAFATINGVSFLAVATWIFAMFVLDVELGSRFIHVVLGMSSLAISSLLFSASSLLLERAS